MSTQTEKLPEKVSVKIELQDSDVESVLDSDWQDSDSENSDNDKQLTLTTDGAVAIPIPKQDQLRPTFGNIAVQNSTDVHFGNKTFYQGPVVIKQFYGAPTPGALEGSGGTQNDNKGFVDDFCDVTFSEDRDKVNNNKTKTVVNGGVQNGGDIDSGVCPKGVKWFQKTWNLRKKSLIVTAVTAIIMIITLITILTVKPYEGDTILSQGDKLRIVTRLEWLAQPPDGSTPLELPATKVIITHTATDFCFDQATCTFHVRYIQSFHIESKHWWDIAYNFLVGGDGSVYEGRGWDAEGSHTKGFNKKSIAIAFIGTFNNVKPPQRQINAARKLIESGVAKGKLSKDYKLYGHRQLIPSLSPGDALFEEIKTWPHWTYTLNDTSAT